MNGNGSFALRLATAFAFVMLLSTAAFAVDRYDSRGDYRGDQISVQGRVTSVARVGDEYAVTLDHGGNYTYYVPVNSVRARDLRIGDRVRLNGAIEGNRVNANMIAFNGEPSYRRDPNYRMVPYGSNGWMAGTVTSVNRHLGYLWMRDDATGQAVKIDTRNVPEHLTVRNGEHISVNGSWERRDLFGANHVVW